MPWKETIASLPLGVPVESAAATAGDAVALDASVAPELPEVDPVAPGATAKLGALGSTPTPNGINENAPSFFRLDVFVPLSR